ncbi:phosphopantetheine-binding protein [uncultured Clostridium sp.]|uniref:phosphopantetheine-binding protein n=1 Tax=uncultured Clostridium sp. TaxID=59620 RepID=UPI0025D5572B|nr:phosphopantetheine-binding protein [uncultured Clostridium sp.]
MNRSEVVLKIKEMLIDRLMLDITVEDIKDDTLLFDSEVINRGEEKIEEGLGLDSVDALEIIVGIQELFTIKLDTDKNPEVFKSVSTLADYVMANASVE